MAKMTLPEFMRRLAIRYEISATRRNDEVTLRDRDETNMELVFVTGEDDDRREFVIRSDAITVRDHEIQELAVLEPAEEGR